MRIRTYVDYAQIRHLSTSAAVIIAAHYDRLATLIGSVPPTINIESWSSAVFKKLFEIGFFEIVGLTDDEVADRYRDVGDSRTMRLLSGSNAAGLERAESSLLELSQFILAGEAFPDHLVIALNTALSEAMINVASHAYPDGHPFKFRHVGKWWVTAEADRSSRTLTVVIYDQGATIPVTYPNKTLSRAAADIFARARTRVSRFEFGDDGAYIEAAMVAGNTQTENIYRGYGLSQMRELIDICGSGKITIYSRGGMCEYSAGGTTSTESVDCSIGGTLVEWVIQLPEPGHAG